MKILSIDTAGPVIGVGYRHDAEVSVRTERIQRGSDARILPWAVELVAADGAKLQDLDGVAVAIGPGSFTGLRVGMAAAMGLSQSIGCPVWGASSLLHRALAADAPVVLSMMDARKGRVYAALIDASGCCLKGPADVEPAVAIGWCVEQNVIATGEGAIVFSDMCLEAGLVLASEPSSPAVAELATLGADAILNGKGLRALELRPEYLRDPDAKKPKGL